MLIARVFYLKTNHAVINSYLFLNKTNSMQNDFKFFLPIEFSKAKNENGVEVMKIGGIASTSAKDSDGEYLDPNGFDVSYFIKQGFFNWHHMAKNDPSTIIGEPTKAEIKPDGLYVEGFLYDDSQIAKSVWSTAKMLDKSSKTRRLGFSIEGKALKRRSDDEKNPNYKYIEKAAITGCAVTFMPKNPKTFLDIIKGDIDNNDFEYEEEDKVEIEKMLEAGQTTGTETTNNLTTASGAPLKKESVDEDEKDLEFGNNKKIKLQKSLTVDKILNRLPDINKKQAEKIFDFLQKGFEMKKEITEENFEKAIISFEKAVGNNEDKNNSLVSENDTEEQVMQKAIGLSTFLKGCGSTKSKAMKFLIEKGFEFDIVKAAATVSFKEDEDEEEGEIVEKGISQVIDLINDKNYSVGVILKAMFDKMIEFNTSIQTIEKGISNDLEKAESGEELEKISTTTLNTEEIQKAIIASVGELMDEKIERIEKGVLSQPNQRKSITAKPKERNFQTNDIQKSEEGGNFISQHDKKTILQILDSASFEKGYDPEFAEAMVSFENGASISPKVIHRLKTEKNINIK